MTKTYAITHDQIDELADAICLLDWIKNHLSDASPEKAEAAVKAIRCHALLEGVLGDDAGTLYSNDQQERATPQSGRLVCSPEEELQA